VYIGVSEADEDESVESVVDDDDSQGILHCCRPGTIFER